MLEERIAALRADTKRGSSALGDEALAILGEAAEQAPAEGFLDAVGDVARALVHARPAMVALENRVHKVMASLLAAEAPPEALRGIAVGLCDAAREQAAQEREGAARCAADALGGRRVLTVSWSDTVARALELAAGKRPLAVVVPQGWPLRDGERAAERLALLGLDVQLVPDAALGRAALDCDAGLVGADAILASGDVVNRAGTSLAALSMAVGGRPFWVVAESAKVTWRDALPLEEGPAEEVWRPNPLLAVKVANPRFDATPAALVRSYCTEQGPLLRPELVRVAERHRQRAAWMD